MEESKKKRQELISDCLMVAGGITVSIGVGLLHIAAGIIVGGALAMVFGWLIGKGGDD